MYTFPLILGFISADGDCAVPSKALKQVMFVVFSIKSSLCSLYDVLSVFLCDWVNSEDNGFDVKDRGMFSFSASPFWGIF